jgi:hypothetical protein
MYRMNSNSRVDDGEREKRQSSTGCRRRGSETQLHMMIMMHDVNDKLSARAALDASSNGIKRASGR